MNLIDAHCSTRQVNSSHIHSFHLSCDNLVYHLPPNHRHVPLGELAISRLEVRGYVFHELAHEDLIRRQHQLRGLEKLQQNSGWERGD